MLPNGQSKPFPHVPSLDPGEKSISLATSPPQEAAESHKVISQPPFLLTVQAQRPQPPLRGHAFH